MKKILHISNYYYPAIGGIEQVARDMVGALKDSDDIQQKVICFNSDAENEQYKCSRKDNVVDIVDGIEIIRCGCIAKIASQSISLSYYKNLKEIMKNFAPDIVVFHYPNPYAAHMLLRCKQKFKLVIYWHSDIIKQKVLKKFFHRQNLRLIDKAEYVIGATPKHVNESEYSKYFANKKRILPYMINEELLILTEEEKDKAENIKKIYGNKKICFFIGRHVEYKGIKYLIEASKKLGDEPVIFLIAGEGKLTDELKKQAEGDNKIIFLGKISNSERKLYMYLCDIICFPSITRNEAFGLGLAEGMYFGKPAVTFSIYGSGVNYVNLDKKTGFECKNSDSDEYAAAIKTLIFDDKTRTELGINARNRILDNFTMDKFKKNVKKLVDDL